MSQNLEIRTNRRTELVDVTDKVQDVIEKSKTKEGICIIYCPHTTAAVTINENVDPNVKTDITQKLNELIPENAGYHHVEGNSDSHIKASLMGNSRIVPVSDGRLLLGQWEGLFFAEFDGPRNRRLLVTVLKE